MQTILETSFGAFSKSNETTDFYFFFIKKKQKMASNPYVFSPCPPISDTNYVIVYFGNNDFKSTSLTGGLSTFIFAPDSDNTLGNFEDNQNFGETSIYAGTYPIWTLITSDSVSLYSNPGACSSTSNAFQGSFGLLNSSTTGDVYIYFTPLYCQCFGPEGDASWTSPETYYSNPPNEYNSTSFTSWGPSFVPSITGTTYTNCFCFYIQPIAPTGNIVTTQSFPTIGYFGATSGDTSGSGENVWSYDLPNNISGGTVASVSCQLLFQMQAPGGDSACTYNSADNLPGPITSYIGFPVSDNGTLTFAYYQVLFLILNGEGLITAITNTAAGFIVNGSSNTNGTATPTDNITAPYLSYPGYALAFYQRVSSTGNCPCLGGQSPIPTGKSSNVNVSNCNSSFPTYYPVMYDANNLYGNQLDASGYPISFTLLGFLNNAFGTSCSTLDEFLCNQGWLEGRTTSSGKTTTGLDIGDVWTGAGKLDLGSDWYFAGYVPYNINNGTINSGNWIPTTEALVANTGATPFCSGTVILATCQCSSEKFSCATAPVSVGNYFWSTIICSGNDNNNNSCTLEFNISSSGDDSGFFDGTFLCNGSTNFPNYIQVYSYYYLNDLGLYMYYSDQYYPNTYVVYIYPNNNFVQDLTITITGGAANDFYGGCQVMIFNLSGTDISASALAYLGNPNPGGYQTSTLANYVTSNGTTIVYGYVMLYNGNDQGFSSTTGVFSQLSGYRCQLDENFSGLYAQDC